MADREAVPTRRAVLADLGVVLALFLGAGVLAGLLWPLLVTPVTVVRAESGTFRDAVEQAHRISYDGWFAVLAGIGGLALGTLCAAWRRAHDVVTVLAVTAGGLLAAPVSAGVGAWVGPEDPDRVLSGAEVLTSAPDVVRVYAEGVYLVWPIAALVGALVVLTRGVKSSAGGVSPDYSQPPPKQL